MWSTFRAIAARIGLSADQVETVVRGGKPTFVEDPLNSTIRYVVRSDPDWTQRIVDAWEETLVNSRREPAGMVPISDGQMMILDPNSPDDAISVRVVSGTYDIVLVVAYLGSEQTWDYEENVSHAFALLRGNEGVNTIEPLIDEIGSELGIEGSLVAFTGAGVLSRISAKPPLGIWTIPELLRVFSPEADVENCQAARATADDGSGAMIVVRAGSGQQDYPLYRLADAKGHTVGVLIDFWVDNRPYED